MKQYKRGFLPEKDPLIQLPAHFSKWEAVAQNLPKLMVSSVLRKTIEGLEPFETKRLEGLYEKERAMQILSYIGHAYVWGEKPVPCSLPKVIAKPWYEVATMLGRKPVLSYASYALYNWRKIDPNGPVALGNIALIQNFSGGIDEEWFILIHVDIEQKAKELVEGVVDILEENGSVLQALKKIEKALDALCKTLERMPEHCDPYIYYNRVRPYIHGWKNHPLFPEGLIYEGVAEYAGKPQAFRGETGAQSSIMPMLDALFGITHKADELYHYLQEMREYMPPDDRQFIEEVESRATLRAYVLKHHEDEPELKALYNACIGHMDRFREIHFGFAAHYIQKQHQVTKENPHAVGTGGTPFMKYLRKHKQETHSFLI